MRYDSDLIESTIPFQQPNDFLIPERNVVLN
jgi:hypothetical protein